MIVTAGLVGGGTYYLVNAKAEKDRNNLQVQIDDLNKKMTTGDGVSIEEDSDEIPDPTVGWKILSDTHYGISLKYPDTWPTTKSDYPTASENDLVSVAMSAANCFCFGYNYNEGTFCCTGNFRDVYPNNYI